MNSTLSAAPSLAEWIHLNQANIAGNSDNGHAKSAEDAFAEKEFATELLLRAKERCPQKVYDIFCSIVFHQEKYASLARKYQCSDTTIRKHYVRAKAIFRSVASDLMHNRPLDIPRNSPLLVVKHEPKDVKYPSKKAISRSILVPKKHYEKSDDAPPHYESSASASSQNESASKGGAGADCSPYFGYLWMLFTLLLLICGIWYLYSLVTPSTKGIVFERVIIQSKAGAEIFGDIQNELQVDSQGTRHQVSLSSVAILRTRPEPDNNPRVKNLSDRLSVCIETSEGTQFTGTVSRWLTFKYGSSAKHLDLLAVKEIRSDSFCPGSSCHKIFTARLEHFQLPKSGAM